MKAILLNPGANPQTVDLPDDDQLDALQALVGGNIEYIALPDYDGLGLYCNDEGLLQGLTPSLQVGWHTICGPAVFVSLDDEGNVLGLADEDVADIVDFIDLCELRDPSPA